MSESTRNSHTEDVLLFMGVKRGQGKEISYGNWQRFIELLKQHTGEQEERILHLARSYVGVSERYLREYLNACKEWGTVKAEDGKVFYVGLPEAANLPQAEAEKQERREARRGAHPENPEAFKAEK